MERYNRNTIRITTGAMIIALFTLLLLMNRQTGGLFEEMFIYILPIPMVIYAAKYGWKSALLVFAGMAVFSFFFGNFASIFYSISSALLGLVFGTCLYYKRDMTKTMFAVMGLAAFFNVLSTVALASLFGYDINAEIAEMQEILVRTMKQVGGEAAAPLLDPNFLMRMIVITMVVTGIIQGFIIFQLSLLLLRRLRFPVQKPRPVAYMFPPRWTGFVAAAGYLLGSVGFQETYAGPVPKNIAQSAWICGYMFLLCFGVIAMSLLLRRYVTRNALLIGIISLLLFFMLSPLYVILGLAYVSFGLHEWLLQ